MVRIVLTGTMSQPRWQMKTELEQMGFIVEDRLTSRTDALVRGEKPGQTKLKGAKKIGCPVITEDQLKSKYDSYTEGASERDSASDIAPIAVERVGRQKWMDALVGTHSVSF